MAGFTRRAKLMGFTETITSSCDQVKWEQYGDVAPENVGRVWDDIKRDREFWVHVPPLCDAETFHRINALHYDAADVYFVTARVGMNVQAQTALWLLERGIDWPAVIITPNKGDTAAALRVTHAIDDKAGNAIYTGYAAPKCRSYILDRLCNQFDHEVVGGNVRRVKTVGEFLDDVEKEMM
jgi:hypothetical protein